MKKRIDEQREKIKRITDEQLREGVLEVGFCGFRL